MLAISAISPIKAPMSIIASVTAVSATAVSNRYLWGRPLPRFSSNCGLASEGTGSADSTGSRGSTGSYRSSK